VSLDYSPTGQWLASADVRGGLTIWNMTSRQAHFSTNLLDGRVNALAFSADGRFLAQSTPNQISLWETGRWQRTRTLPQRQVTHLAFSPDGSVLAAANGREVCLWRPADAVLWKRLPTSAREPEPRRLAFTAGGELLAVADANGRVTYWDWRA